MRRDRAGSTEETVSGRVSAWFGRLTTLLITCAGGIVVILATTTPVACFSLKEPACAFSCADPPNLCPANYTCGTDDLCHRAGATALCPLTSPQDGGLEAGDSPDGGAVGGD